MFLQLCEFVVLEKDLSGSVWSSYSSLIHISYYRCECYLSLCRLFGQQRSEF